MKSVSTSNSRSSFFDQQPALIESFSVLKSSTFWWIVLISVFLSLALYESSFLFFSKPTIETLTTNASYVNNNSGANITSSEENSQKLNSNKLKRRKRENSKNPSQKLQ